MESLASQLLQKEGVNRLGSVHGYIASLFFRPLGDTTRVNGGKLLEFRGFREWWAGYRVMLLRAAIVIMAIASLVWLSYQFWRLLWGSAPIWHTSPTGAVDLKILHRLVHEWFAGRPVYRELPTAVHPPATYVLLWPMLGWLDVGPARWLWAVTTVVALTALVYIVVRESRADSSLERAFVALIPCSIYATGAAIGNGQLIVHLLPMMLVGILMLHRRRRERQAHLLASALILATLVKPSISVPFLWLALFVPRFPGPVPLVALGYCVLTLFAVSFQDSTLTALVHDWQSRSSSLAVAAGQGNVANLHVWLGSLGLEGMDIPHLAGPLAGVGPVELSLPPYRYLDPDGCHRLCRPTLDLPSVVRRCADPSANRGSIQNCQARARRSCRGCHCRRLTGGDSSPHVGSWRVVLASTAMGFGLCLWAGHRLDRDACLSPGTSPSREPDEDGPGEGGRRLRKDPQLLVTQSHLIDRHDHGRDTEVHLA